MFLKDNILPLIGMNKDDEPRYFEQGDYVEARNIEISNSSDQSDQNVIHSIKSGQSYALPSIGYTEIAHQHLAVAEDIENKRKYVLTLINSEVESLTTLGGEVLTTKGGVPLTIKGGGYWYFVIYKHELEDNTFKIILQQEASTWGLYDWSISYQEVHNPRIVNGNLVWTDNTNDIRMINLERMEATTDMGLTGAAELWDSVKAASPGYLAGEFVWYKSRVYEVLQQTSSSTEPANAPTYYEDKASVNDVYLDVSDPNNFVLAALPPLIAPTADYVPDASINVNQLRGKTWQFSYRYIYMDYRKSVYASPSLVPPPDKEETLLGAPNPDTTHNNRLLITLNTGNEEVRSIEVVARSSEDPSTWYLIKEILVVNAKGWRVYPANTDINISFYNDTATTVVDPVEVYKPFSYVPIRAKHMELIEGNRLVFANITEGYSRIAANVSVDLSWESLAGITQQKTNFANSSYGEPGDPGEKEWQLQFTLPAVNPGACTFYIRVNRNDNQGLLTALYVYNGTDSYPSTVKTGLLAAMEVTWSGETTSCIGSGDLSYKICAFPETLPDDIPDPYTWWTVQSYYEQSVITDIYKYPSLKTGVLQSWGMVYRDKAGRISPVVGGGEIKKYIPFVTENTDSNVGVRPLVSFNINHTPPDWADSYEIVYAGNKSIKWHLHLLGHNYSYGKKNHDTALSTPDYEHYRLRIKSCQDKTRNFLNNWSVEEYSWEKGDRIRIIGKVDDGGVLTEINNFFWDTEIVAVYTDTDPENYIGEGSGSDDYQDTWIYFKINPNILYLPSTGTLPLYWEDNLFVEIYRPAVTETGLFFTTGMTFDIKTDINGNKYHGGDTDQTINSEGNSITPAIVNNTAHDIWKYIRNFRSAQDNATFKIWSESEYPSDFYVSQKMTSQGKPIPNVDSQQQNVLTKRVRHGGIIGIGSQINRLADFEYDDYKDLKDEFGPIEGVREVGFVLKTIQQSKVTSIYINRLESFKASGEPEYLFTDKVFGSARPTMENWGTQHPGSVCVYNRHLYFWDQREGIVVRDAANGQIAISDYKMQSYFANLAETMAEYDEHDQKVEFVYNSRNNELFCMFGGSAAEKQIITFSENNQRWRRFIDVELTFSKHYTFGRRLFTVYEGDVIEWYKGSDYNVVAGTTARPEIQVCAVAEPGKPKVFNSVIVYSTITERRFEFVEVTVPALATAGEGAMVTNIYDVNINRRESAYYCQILRDVNTPGSGTQSHKEMNGRWMRGLYAKVHIRGTEASVSNKFELTNLIVVSTPSERSM